MIPTFGVCLVSIHREVCGHSFTDFVGPEHSRLKDYIAQLDGKLDAKIQEGGKSSTTSQVPLTRNWF